MKWCVCFPEEDILIKRPCLRRACLGNKTSAALLGFFLYQVSISKEFRLSIENSDQSRNEERAMPTQKMDINIHKTQLEIIAEMDNEISDRTLRDTAIPLLVALRYIDVDESDKANIYTIHLAQVQRGIHNPPKTSEVLPALQHLIEDGSTSDKCRKYFLRLLAILPTSTGKSSDSQKRTRVAHKEERGSFSSKDKKKKSNNDHRKIQVVAIQTDEMQKESVMSSATAIQPPSEVFLRDVPSEIQPQQEAATRKPQSLDQNAPRTVKTVLQLMEFLRGQRFREPERAQQARAAAILIGIQPALTLKDIHDAWLHGSDEYWKKNHDQAEMTVIDLAFLPDSQAESTLFKPGSYIF
jgi:hypothetical protein